MAGCDCICGGILCIVLGNYSDSTITEYKCSRCGRVYSN